VIARPDARTDGSRGKSRDILIVNPHRRIGKGGGGFAVGAKELVLSLSDLQRFGPL